jgi:hypothetical protein
MAEAGHSRRSTDGLISINTLTGTYANARLDGRPRRAPKVPEKYRGKFMDVLDETGKNAILIYVEDDGTIRRDVKKVQDELEAQGIFQGMHDTWEVDLDELDEADKVEDVEAESGSGDDEFDGDEEEEEQEDDAVEEDKDSDSDYVPGADEEEEECDEEYESDTASEPDDAPVEEPDEDEDMDLYQEDDE